MLAGRDQEFRTSTLNQYETASGAQRRSSRRVGRVSTVRPARGVTRKCEVISGVSRNHIYRHHVQPRVKLHVPSEGSVPIPLKSIAVGWRTSKTFEALLESRTDD